ncbi:MAG: response regulator [Chloroflexota bacterium]|nr:response regulator [Chloroflexota bacterium]
MAACSVGPRIVVVGVEMLPDATVRGSETVLVIEDDNNLRELLQEVLSDYGYSVIGASDGEQGVEVFARQAGSIALVISDLMLPKVRGKQLYKKLHSIKPGIKMLFVSGHSVSEVSYEFEPSDGVKFLQKPFDLERFVAILRELLA